MMINKILKVFLVSGIFYLLLFSGDFSSADAPGVIEQKLPDDKAKGVPVNAEFKWVHDSNAEKYSLKVTGGCIIEIGDLDVDDPEELNSCPEEGGIKICSLGFLKISNFCSIEEGTPGEPLTYSWKVKGCDGADNCGPYQAEFFSFTTEISKEPPPPSPPPDGDGGPPAELTPPIAAETLEELFTAIINFLFYLVMALAPIMIIWAAFLIMTAAGKAEQVNKGKTIILWTLVAVAIVLMTKGLPAVVKGVLGG